jgi:lauroyl/myristoyl acyltransferase
LGSQILPTFVTREAGDKFILRFDEPFCADQSKPEDEAVDQVVKISAELIEDRVKQYPTQWYIFKDMWKKDE